MSVLKSDLLTGSPGWFRQTSTQNSKLPTAEILAQLACSPNKAGKRLCLGYCVFIVFFSLHPSQREKQAIHRLPFLKEQMHTNCLNIV